MIIKPYQLLNKKGKLILESNSPIDIFIGGVAYYEFKVPVKHMPKLISAAVDCYLKADVISLGHFADFVSKHYKLVLNLYNEKGRQAVLDAYWNSEEYNSTL